MEQAQRRSTSMVFVLVVSAIFCAAATFIAVTLVANRSAPPETIQPDLPDQVLVDGMLITLSADPDKAIYMLGENVATIVPEIESPTQLPPDTTLPTEVPPPTSPPPTAPPPTPVPDSVIFIGYVVQQGDSLYSIANEQNSAIELMALHGIDGDDMVPGQNLNLPVANPAYCPSSRAYVVRDNDTVFRIAHAFNTTPEAIASLNNLDADYTIKTTQVICIPVG